MKPIPNSPRSCWQWYVAAGSTREERVRRLAECPEEMRGEVEKRVREFFKQRSEATR